MERNILIDFSEFDHLKLQHFSILFMVASDLY